MITHEVGVSSASRPDKLVLLFRGKATLLRKHWSPWRRRIGIALLLLGVGVRALFARSGPWPAVWAARRSWVKGYAPAAPRLRVVGADPKAVKR